MVDPWCRICGVSGSCVGQAWVALFSYPLEISCTVQNILPINDILLQKTCFAFVASQYFSALCSPLSNHWNAVNRMFSTKAKSLGSSSSQTQSLWVPQPSGGPGTTHSVWEANIRSVCCTHILLLREIYFLELGRVKSSPFFPVCAPPRGGGASLPPMWTQRWRLLSLE